jgi:hypothetical protein
MLYSECHTESTALCLKGLILQALHVSFRFLSLAVRYLTKYYAMKTYGAMGVQIHVSLASALLEVSSQLHSPAGLPPQKEPQVPLEQEVGLTPEWVWTTWIRENSCPYRGSNLDP